MSTVAIVNVTSYTGMELLRLLIQHPQFVLTSATSRSAAGQRLGDVFPQVRVRSLGGPEGLTPVDPQLIITEEPALTDLAFVCLPPGAAAESVLTLRERGVKVIDFSADFRLHDRAQYEEWYKRPHPAPELLETAVYGLCERYRKQIEKATLIANPGCYATASILGLIPALATGIITPDVIIDAKSGLSGAGQSLTLGTHYAEANEDASAYSLAGHRHLPEITQELEAAARAGGHPISQLLRITFIPHLIPMTRGILATCYADLNQEAQPRVATTAEAYSLYKDYYADEPFVQVVEQAPHTKWAHGTNACFISPTVDMRTKRLVVVACLDNLVKGAAGQAIQNANRLCGLAEATGLESIAVYP